MEKKRGDIPETKRLVLGSAFSRAWGAGEFIGGMKLVEKSRLKPRVGPAAAALRVKAIFCALELKSFLKPFL